MKEDAKKVLYNNRELSWIDFNTRVLEEAFKKENPVMERVKFLSICASNLDEFFMIRVAGIMDQVSSNYKKPDPSGLTPKQQLSKVNKGIHQFLKRQYFCWESSIKNALKKENIVFLKISDLNDLQLNKVCKYFDKIIFPVLTPLAIDRSRPFPLLLNRSLNIAVSLEKDRSTSFAVVQVPSILSRVLEVPAEKGRSFVLLEDIIMSKIERLFEPYEIKACFPFRVTRNADLDIDDEREDLIIAVQKSIKKRKRGKPVRLEIPKKCDSQTRKFLIDTLDVEKPDVYEVPGPIDLTFLAKFTELEGFEHLCFAPLPPVNPPGDFYGYDDFFEAIRQKDRMVHHPYESFDAVLNFVKQAAADKDVLAIKQTLYRVSGESPIIDALMTAAENGKQVTVLVELKARFDEENNIIWAKKLEQAGCHVIYGLSGLKTHCKILLVVRREEEGIRRYVHMATGNYNNSTAKLYTDIGLFTCRETFGIDASSLFNFLTGYSGPPEYSKMIVAPFGMRKFFEKMIENEIENAKNSLPSGITIKVNSLVDVEIVKLLYKASKAGVNVQLIVRGICCLVPGVDNISENISVISIVGRFLEHSRIYKFECGGMPKIFIGSADLMPRNLDWRVELAFPIDEEDLKERVSFMLDLMLSDTTNARMQLSDTTYRDVPKSRKSHINSHLLFYKVAKGFKDRTQT
ncbi:MAG: Polyphosphate kinase [Eubacteriales bacterium SKADARSKE-1]|nr:Polyphosphate kinase [Eubacteriales bacterium SKADARSKE-1]